MMRSFRLLALSVLLFIGAQGCERADPPIEEHFDLLIRGGLVVDGTGTDPYMADVGVREDRIEAVGDLAPSTADTELAGEGLIVAPGFIDLHSHAEAGLVSEERSPAHALLAQGITTVVVNADGRSPDLVEQRERFLQHGLGVNVAQLVGFNTARTEAMDGNHDRPPTPDELDAMKAIVRAGMEAGAFGMSSGLFYTPGSFSETDEVIEVARVAAEYGGVHSSHIRDESDYTVGVIQAVQEIIDIAEATGATGIVSHIKALGPNVWGASEEIVARIEAARERGVSVWADQYPYAASQTSLAAALIPSWALDQSSGGLEGRMEDPELATEIREAVVDNLVRRGGADRLQFTRGDFMGRTLADYAESHGLDEVEATLDVVLGDHPAGIVSHNMNEEDIVRLMRQPWTATSTDGLLPVFGEGVPHPRGYGAFARKLEVYVESRGDLTLSQAIRSMTSVGAEAMGIPDRGRIAPGYRADLVVFDRGEVRDNATYMEPHALASGMVHVVVNGTPVKAAGTFTDALPGRILDRH